MNNKRILVIAGPTGVGESTITNKIIEKYPVFTRMITATSRNPRLNEQDKVDYYFFSKEEFKKEIEKDNMLEYTCVRDEVYYGSYKPELEKKLSEGKNIIINLDLVGAKYYKENYNATTIFIMPDSIDNLKMRHIARGASNKEELEKRIDYAVKEVEEESPHYDYRVVNKQDQLDNTLKEVFDIIKKEGYKLVQ